MRLHVVTCADKRFVSLVSAQSHANAHFICHTYIHDGDMHRGSHMREHRNASAWNTKWTAAGVRNQQQGTGHGHAKHSMHPAFKVRLHTHSRRDCRRMSTMRDIGANTCVQCHVSQ